MALAPKVVTLDVSGMERMSLKGLTDSEGQEHFSMLRNNGWAPAELSLNT